ncbi:MAG: BrnT family toxin [Clostridiales bacterium]|nr:BrnT family toxin [Clostridiales bacterium]
MILDDEEHSNDEDRFVLIGYSEGERLLTVCHCYRYDGEIIRIISARKANKTEHKFYGGAF